VNTLYPRISSYYITFTGYGRNTVKSAVKMMKIMKIIKMMKKTVKI